jgi:hypothetical protein
MDEEKTMDVQKKKELPETTPGHAPKTLNSEIRPPKKASATATTIPATLEDRIVDLAEGMCLTVMPGSITRHEIEIKFKVNGREESLYINRKSFWRKELLKVTLRPALSEKTSGRIVSAECASRLLQKGVQMESYSSNYRAFNNRQLAKGSKNEHFGHAWTVPIDDNLSNLKTFFETVQAGY